MTPSLRRFRDRIATDPLPSLGLSPQGAEAARKAATDALADAELDAALQGGRPFDTACVAIAGTVPTAPIEWCAVLLGLGTAVTIKHPTGDPGLAEWLCERAGDLPLTCTPDRDAVTRADLVVAMGSDASVAAIRAAARPSARVLTHGHRFSAAYIESAWDEVALDAALQDGRGCMSPVAVFTPTPLAEATEALAAAVARRETELPRGEVAPAELADIRTREALSRAQGGHVHRGPAWSVHSLPEAQFSPVALPRAIQVISASSSREAARILHPHRHALSTVGTDADPTVFAPLATRICRAGRMQHPPLRRSHDGEDWLTALRIAVCFE